MWSRLKGSIAVLAFLAGLYFVTVLLQQRFTLEASSFLHTAIRGDQQRRPTKLLVLAYPRTGSSLVGDILSASPNSSFIFEPLFKFEPFGNPIDAWHWWNASVLEHVEKYINELFNCDSASSELTYFLHKHKRLQDCKVATKRVIKTIRLHKINLHPWILDSDIKIVHVIRDPRAVYSSMAKQPKTWKGSLENVNGMCQRMLQDYILGKQLPSYRYFLLKYEELLQVPITTLVNLYSKLDLEFDISSADALFNHTRLAVDQVDQGGYYSTYRATDNDIFKWKNELKIATIRHVEKNCREFMDTVGYINEPNTTTKTELMRT